MLTTVEMVGPAGQVVVLEADVLDHVARGYRAIPGVVLSVGRTVQVGSPDGIQDVEQYLFEAHGVDDLQLMCEAANVAAPTIMTENPRLIEKMRLTMVHTLQTSGYDPRVTPPAPKP